MKSPTNIVILTPGFAANEGDTSAIPALQAYVLALRSRQPALHIGIIAIQYPHIKGNYYWNGIPVYSAAGKGRKSNRLLVWFTVLVQLINLHRKQKIDLVHAFWLTEATLLGQIFYRLTRTRFLTTAMGQDVRSSNRYLKLFKPLPLDVVVLSEFQLAYLKCHLSKVNFIKVIPFGIDPQYFQSDGINRTTNILGVGSLNQVKDYDTFLKVISSVVKKFPELTCNIIGEGSERGRIEESIKKLGMELNIRLLGRLDYKDTIDEMHRCQILLHTSRYESQGLIFTEALASGLDVVCFPVGIAATLKSDKLFTGQKEEELVDHLLNLLERKEVKKSPEIVYTIGETCDEYMDIYEKILS